MNPPNIKIRRQNRKSVSIRLLPQGVLVLIPRWMEPDSPEVQAYIHDGLQKINNRVEIPAQPLQQITSEDEIFALVESWSTRMRVRPNKVRLREMYRSWGTCSKKGNISLNRQLCYVPQHLVEYVVCHELVHLRFFDHSRAFWATLRVYLPDCDERKQELDNWRFFDERQ